MTLQKYTNTDGYNSKVANGQLPDAQYVKAIMAPFGAILPWHKTFGILTSGTADTNTTDKLVDTSATFITGGVVSGMIVRNTGNNSFAIVDTVESETSILLKADTQAGSTNADIFPNGTEAYTIYVQRELPGAYYELNGQTISDSDSPFNGETLPDMNSDLVSGQGGRFIRGSNTSGTLQNDLFRAHDHEYHEATNGDNNYGIGSISKIDIDYNARTGSTGGVETRPYNISMVWIMRVK